MKDLVAPSAIELLPPRSFILPRGHPFRMTNAHFSVSFTAPTHPLGAAKDLVAASVFKTAKQKAFLNEEKGFW